MSRPRLLKAQDEGLRARLFEFRYQVYAGELGSLLSATCHQTRRMQDPSDDVAHNYVALVGDEVVGSLRVVDLRDQPPAHDLDGRFSLALLREAFAVDEICLAGRLAVAPRYRRGTLVLQLIAQAYQDARARGIRLGLSDCSPALLSLYETIGYVRFGVPFNDPVFGFKQPIAWALGDVGWMKEMRSPLARLAARFPPDEAAAAWFRAQGNQWRQAAS